MKKIKIPYKRNKELRKYFDKNDLGYSNSAKKDNSRYQIHLMFDKNYHTEEYFPFFMAELSNNLVYLEYLWKSHDKEYQKDGWTPDRRSGEESYGYGNLESIIGNLNYIEDRWNCQFRIKWLINLVDFYKKNKKDISNES